MSENIRNTSGNQRSAAADRQARFRARKKAAETSASPLLYERADWQLFVQAHSLPQQAGCAPDQLGRIVVKELVDNGLDSGGKVDLSREGASYTVSDTGPGIDPDLIPRLFAVNRPLLSSKLKRLPLRGMIGNGLRVVMGAVAAHNGAISVASRGQRLVLKVDTLTGLTMVVDRAPAPSVTAGTTVTIALPIFDGTENRFASWSMAMANTGESYDGASDPAWYDATTFAELFARVSPADTTATDLVLDAFGADVEDPRPARALSPADVAALREALLLSTPRVPPERIGYIGRDVFDEGHSYHRATGIARIRGAHVPYAVEVWVNCRHADKGDRAHGGLYFLLNRSLTITPLQYAADSLGLHVEGCGIEPYIPSAKRGVYTITMSLITPYVQLMNDGKTPFLANFHEGTYRALQKATGAAYRAMSRPKRQMSLKAAAGLVMRQAYQHASSNGRLPANARQIMYAVRPLILNLTGAISLNDKYFTQTLLPDFMNEHPEETAAWDVVFDARGHLREPHTGRVVPIGTLAVRSYLGDRPQLGPAVQLHIDSMFPTSGPEHRFRTILNVEKEGFDPLLEQTRISERLDVAIMSTKGTSVTAARQLIDRLAGEGLIDRVLVVHDFDVSGFTIFGTLGRDGRRYVYENEVEVIDLGLRLADVAGLQSEPVEIKESERAARALTLEENGATEEEIAFLLGYDDGQPRRVELNAMTSQQFIHFLEAKLAQYCTKVVPPDDIIEMHARRLVEKQITKQALDAMHETLAKEAAEHPLPADLRQQVEALLAKNPEFSWDLALAVALRQAGPLT